MKLIKTIDKVELLLNDNIIVSSDNVKLYTESEVGVEDITYYINFVPRREVSTNIVYDYLTVDSMLVSVDNTLITADTTYETDIISPTITLTVIREFDNKIFKPDFVLSSINNLYRLSFLDTDFLSKEGRYSVLIEDTIDNKTHIIYKGKMIYSLKDIQNYRYTIINNTKMYI